MRIELLVAAALACGCRSTTDHPAASGSAGSGGSTRDTSPTSDSAATPDAAPDATPIAAPVAAVSSKLIAARCDEPCLFLSDTPLDKLQDAYKARCGGKETKDPGFQDCRQLDYVRNCVYAAHGLVYKKKQWKQLFEGKPWYEPHPELSAKTMLSPVELANVHELHTRSKACKHGLFVSGGDAARLTAWFQALPHQPPLPKVLFHADEAVDAQAFMQVLHTEFGDGKVDLRKAQQAEYERLDEHPDEPVDQQPGPLAGAIHAPGKLRAILVMFLGDKIGPPEEDMYEQTRLHFLYDEHDQLVGVSVGHYAYD